MGISLTMRRRAAACAGAHGGAHARGRTSRAAGPLYALILLALAATLLAGCSVDIGGGDSPATIGERAANDKVAVTVHSVKTYTKITTEDGDVLTMQSPKNVYLVADITIRNLQDTALAVDPENVRLVKSDDKYWAGDGGDLSVSNFPEEFKALKARSLGAGKQVRGMVVYGVPKGTELKSITYVADPDIAIGLAGKTVKAPPVKLPPKVGGTAKGGGLAFTVSSLTYPTSLTHGLWTTSAKSGNKLVLLKVTVRNLDRTPSYKVDPLSVALVDANGKRWGPFNRSDLGVADSEQFPMKHLRRGAKASGKVVISVPKTRQVEGGPLRGGRAGPAARGAGGAVDLARRAPTQPPAATPTRWAGRSRRSPVHRRNSRGAEPRRS